MSMKIVTNNKVEVVPSRKFHMHSQITESLLNEAIVGESESVERAFELGEKIYFSKGSEKNLKLTTLDDIDIFKALLSSKRADWLK